MARRKPPPLPKPDDHGNFWFGDRKTGPAVFRSGVEKEVYFALVSPAAGFLLAADGLRYYGTAEEALAALAAAGAFA